MEENLRRIVSETCRLCREKDVKADEFLIAYLACLQEVRKSLDAVVPGASLHNTLEPSQIAIIGQLLVKLLAEKDSPVLAATRMQVSMEVVFKRQREAVEKEQAEREENVGMARRAVTQAPYMSNGTTAAYDKMYAKVLTYCATATGMDLALVDDGAKEEVRAALGSVFPLSSLARFLTLREQEKTEQVEELARVTLGVCLFNRAVGRGGYALPPGASSYLPQANRLLRDIGRHIHELSSDVEGCAALMRLYSPQANQGGEVAAAPAVNQQHLQQRERAQAEAIHKAQCLVLYEGLSMDLASGVDAVTSLEAELQHMLVQVQDAVGGSSAVPKERVFPMFDRLGAIHQALSEELRLLVVRQRLADELEGMMGGYVTLLQRMAKTRRPGRKTQVEEELARGLAALAITEPQQPEVLADGVEYVPPPPGVSLPRPASSRSGRTGSAGSTSQHSGKNGSAGDPERSRGEAGTEDHASLSHVFAGMALNGFDTVLLVKQGQLRRAIQGLGTLRYEGAVYGFASFDSMTAFAKEPASAVASVTKVIGKQPVLARLLGRGSAYPLLDIHSIVVMLSKSFKVDFGTQTPTHFIEHHIDYSYEWNEWALRRRALALANLRQKKTHSTQTALTHFKRDMEAQVWQPKAATVQTVVQKGQTMPKKLQYVAGLRGAPDTKMKVIRLELDMGQPHQY